MSLASAAAVVQNLDRAALRSRPDPHREGRPLDARRSRCRRSIVGRRRDRAGAARRRHAPARGGREAHLRGASRRRARCSPSTRASQRDADAGHRRCALDVVFPVLHGPYGEDGTVQGLLELANVPYVGAGVLASAVGMDKAVMKLVFAAQRAADLRLRSRAASATGSATSARVAADASSTRLGFPVFVKPANLGSSVGISKAKHAAELRAAIDARRASSTARSSSRRRCRTRARSKCAVLGNDEPEASVPGEIVPSREFYDYEAKYLDDDSRADHPGAARPRRRPAEVRRAGDRGVQGDRRRRHGARRLPARRRQPACCT